MDKAFSMIMNTMKLDVYSIELELLKSVQKSMRDGFEEHELYFKRLYLSTIGKQSDIIPLACVQIAILLLDQVRNLFI